MTGGERGGGTPREGHPAGEDARHGPHGIRANNSYTRFTDIEPSPAAEGPRFTEPLRTSLVANTPGRHVAPSLSGRHLVHEWALMKLNTAGVSIRAQVSSRLFSVVVVRGTWPLRPFRRCLPKPMIGTLFSTV